MKKSDAKVRVPELLAAWKAACFPVTPTQELHSSDFIDWLRQHHSEVLTFRSTMGAESDIEQWFAAEFSQSWRY